CGHRMEDVRTALLFAQAIVGGPDIEDQHTLVPGKVSDRKELLCRKIRQDVGNTFRHKRLERRHDIRTGLYFCHIEGEPLPQEGTCGVIVADGDLCARNTFVSRGKIKDRKRQLRLISTQIAELDLKDLWCRLGRLLGSNMGRTRNCQKTRYNQEEDIRHRASPQYILLEAAPGKPDLSGFLGCQGEPNEDYPYFNYKIENTGQHRGTGHETTGRSICGDMRSAPSSAL